MKRILVLTWLIVALAACGGDKSPPASTATSVPPTATTAPTPLPSVTPTPLAAPPTLESNAGSAEPTAAPAPATPAGPQLMPTPTVAPEVLEAAALPPAQPEPAAHPGYAESECSDKYPCNEDVAGWEARIRVPAGFQATYYARVDAQPTNLTFGPDGLLYVTTLGGSILTVDDAGNSETFFSGLIAPTGLAFQPGTERLYVSDRVVNVSDGGESQVSYIEEGQRVQIIGGLSCCYAGMHAAQSIVFGPDGYGYVGVGARADHGEILGSANVQGERGPLEAAILRFHPNGSEVEAYAVGLRNPYGIAFDGDGVLYATDNGPDFGPPEEFHRIVPGAEHGYPYYDCPACFGPPPGVEVLPPTLTFIPHSSPTGLTSYLAAQFPGYYNSLFAILWSAFEGAQKVVHIAPGGTAATDFAQGFAQPIGIAVGPNGSLYAADFATGIIFRIDYVGE